MSNALISQEIETRKSYSVAEKQSEAMKMRHFNDDALILLNEGMLSFQGAGFSYNLYPGSVAYIRSGAYIWNESAVVGEKYKAVEIEISSHFIGLFLRKHADSMSICFDANCDAGYSPIFFSATKVFRDTVNALYELNSANHPEKLSQHKLEEVLLLLLYSSNGRRLAALLRQTVLMSSERLRTFMESHFLKNWRLDKFAQEFGTSLTAFKDLFNEIYGVAPKAWISDRRLLYAYQLLRSSNKSVVDVSLEAGFSSQSYFAQAFRRRFSMAPSQARKCQSKN